MKYTVIGLGQFGQNLCLELAARNMEVVAVGKTDESVDEIKDDVTLPVVMDYTNPNALKELELGSDSAVLVTIGDSFEENLLVITHLQKMGIKHIFARVMNPVHEHILKQMNVYAMINMSRMAALQLASQLESADFLRASPIDEEHSLVELEIPDFWIGQTLAEVDLRQRHKLNLITVRRGSLVDTAQQSRREMLSLPRNPVMDTPQPDMVFEENDILVLFGREDDLIKFANFTKGR